MITRQEFVKICTDAIHQTRAKVIPSNQVSGYLEYHEEIKANRYMSRYRLAIKNNIKRNGYSFAEQHAFIEHAGMGYCIELGEYLGAEIIARLKEKQGDANAIIYLVKSKEVDHVYLHISICLQDEKYPSLWEVDAWDPRMIDRSPRPNDTIKNQERLVYGVDVITKRTAHAADPLIRFHDTFSNLIKKPTPGQLPNHTPRKEVTKKHQKFFADYSLERAYSNGVLNKTGKIDYVQAQSAWQSAKPIDYKRFNFFEADKKRKRDDEGNTHQVARKLCFSS